MRSVLKNKKAEIMGMSDIFIYIIGGILVVLVVLLVFGKDWGGMIRGFLPGFNSSNDTHYDEITGSDELVYNLPADLPSYVDPNGKITGCPYFAFKVGEGLFGIYNSSGNRIGAFKKKTIPAGSWDLYDLKGVVKVYEQGKIDNSGILNQFNSYGEKYDSAINFIFNGEKIICGDSAGVNVKDSSVIVNSEEYYVSQKDCFNTWNFADEYCIMKKNSTGEYKTIFYFTINIFKSGDSYLLNYYAGILGASSEKSLCSIEVGNFISSSCFIYFQSREGINMQKRVLQENGEFVLVNPNVISEIVEFKGSGNFEVLSDEECRSGLAQRKTDLGIPDKLCYWQAMTEVYDNKCDNLDKAQISEIFEKKAEYRQLNNPDWPSLNVDGDFCVPVIYDCGEWKLRVTDGTVNGFFNPNNFTIADIIQWKEDGKFILPDLTESKSSVSGNPSGEIQINPYKVFTKEFVLNTIFLHEGLHSIQSESVQKIYLADGGASDSTDSAYASLVNKEKARTLLDNMEESISILTDKVDELIILQQNNISLVKESTKYSEEEKKNILSNILVNIKELYGAKESIELADDNIFDPVKLEKIYSETVKRVVLKYEGVDTEFEKNYNIILDLNKQAFVLAYSVRVKTYVSSTKEVDPRLSEVQRWWLEKTVPNCEIIYTKEKAKEVLDLFLAEKNLPDEYKWSQQDLSLLIYIYKGTEYEDDVYNDLISRLPGLASNTETDESVAYV